MNRSELIKIRLELLLKELPIDRSTCVVAVSKKCPFEDVAFAYEAGHRDFGENRVDELLDKARLAFEQGLDDIRWHFIGNLQSNKVAKLFACPQLVAIHSVDSKRLIDFMVKEKHNLPGAIDIFLQVNTSDEKEKGGFQDWDELAMAANHILENSADLLHLKGLMTMSRVRTNNFAEDARKCFKQLYKIKQSLEKDFDLSEELKLSMGMTNDYLIALEEGADCIRVGSKIFSSDPNSRN